MPPAELPFAGREEDLHALITLHASLDADGRVAAITGEAGVGKTRLAQEVVRRLAQQGAADISVRCHAGESVLAYGPIADALRKVLDRYPSRLRCYCCAGAARSRTPWPRSGN